MVGLLGRWRLTGRAGVVTVCELCAQACTPWCRRAAWHDRASTAALVHHVVR